MTKMVNYICAGERSGFIGSNKYHFIDTDMNGRQTILATTTSSFEDRDWLKKNFENWVNEHGVVQ
ncbi:hypothetical protein J2T02_002599 [Chitinophaga terrae (ex Kim and Jung 2007)]|nr:hypothetical protein [Chitinophaga terrae (ex Kim and Jung 2007)]